MIFLGTQPTLTQVPPSVFFSMSATFAPKEAALLAAARPPLPAPITMKSKHFGMDGTVFGGNVINVTEGWHFQVVCLRKLNGFLQSRKGIVAHHD